MKYYLIFRVLVKKVSAHNKSFMLLTSKALVSFCIITLLYFPFLAMAMFMQTTFWRYEHINAIYLMTAATFLSPYMICFNGICVWSYVYFAKCLFPPGDLVHCVGDHLHFWTDNITLNSRSAVFYLLCRAHFS